MEKFYKNKLEENLEITSLPEIFEVEIKEIENEIMKRKEFDMVFLKVTNFLNSKLLVREENRRKEQFLCNKIAVFT